jgi:hypothetical protein
MIWMQGGGSSGVSAVERVLPPRLYQALAHFQREGVEFVVRNNGRAIIADEMGLGKRESEFSLLVVCEFFRDELFYFSCRKSPALRQPCIDPNWLETV